MKAAGEWLRIGATLAALLAALSFLYVQATSTYDAQHRKVVQTLDEMRRVDAELARDALRVRTGLLQQFDPLNDGLARLGDGVARLSAEGVRGAFGGSRDTLEASLARLSRSLADSEERLEQFKSASAVLRNSQLYLGVLQQELAATASAAWQVESGALLNALIRYAQHAEGETANQAELLLRRLAAAASSAALSEGTETLSAHARLVLSSGALADAVLHSFLAAPPGAELQLLEDAYLTMHGRSQERADLYRTLLYAVSLLLLAYLGYVMVRLSATARGLRENVAERVRAEGMLQELNQNLERRVQERTAELQALAREREAFSYSIAHDLRSPLGVISSFCHILAKDEHARLSPEGQRMLQTIEGNVAHLVMLVDALLTLAQVSRVNLERRPIDLAAVATAAATALTPRYPRARVSLGALPVLSGDPTLVAQVVSNLLENALKYSSRAAAAEVSVGWDPAENACYVRDNGVGFDMSHADNLFNAFERLHTNTEFPGSGIGLAIVKRVVERHGGRAWADAAPGRGATFYFSIGAPLEEARAA